MKNLTWQNPEQLFVAQVLINKVKSKCCGIKDDNKDAVHLPNPNIMYLVPGEKGDNAMQMIVTNAGHGAEGGLGSVASGYANIAGNNAEGTVYTETGHSFSNPFNASIIANYPKP